MKGFGTHVSITKITLKFGSDIVCLLIFILKFSKWASEKFASQVANWSWEEKMVALSQWLFKTFNSNISHCDSYSEPWLCHHLPRLVLRVLPQPFSSTFSTWRPALSHAEHYNKGTFLQWYFMPLFDKNRK